MLGKKVCAQTNCLNNADENYASTATNEHDQTTQRIPDKLHMYLLLSWHYQPFHHHYCHGGGSGGCSGDGDGDEDGDGDGRSLADLENVR